MSGEKEYHELLRDPAMSFEERRDASLKRARERALAKRAAAEQNAAARQDHPQAPGPPWGPLEFPPPGVGDGPGAWTRVVQKKARALVRRGRGPRFD